MSQEIFQDIPGYENIYQVSNKGRVKSFKGKKERILRAGVFSNGYLGVVLAKENRAISFTVHKLMAITFLNHTQNGNNIVVDHIDNNKLNNNLENLQLISNRLNCSKDKKGTSKYTGVSWNTSVGKWYAHIVLNSKRIHLGIYDDELEASIAYNNALNDFNNKNI